MSEGGRPGIGSYYCSAPVGIRVVTRTFRMNINHGRSRPALLLLGAALLMVSLSVSRGADGQSGLVDSPFGPTAAAPATVPAGIEFRGVVREGDVWLVNLYQAATKKSHWVPVGGEAAGLLVKSYDEATGRVAVMQGGQPLFLPLKQSRVLLKGDNTPLKLLSAAERITEAEAPQMPDFMRDLPPEARKLLEEARRRRAIRWPTMSAGVAPAVARP